MRAGVIRITDVLYQNSWEEISVIFKKFRPTHIEFRNWENGIWYFYGTCDEFDEILESQVVTEYTVIFTRSEDGTHEYKFERV